MSDITDATPRILREIQKSLTEMRLLSDIDKRNNRALYDSLTYEVARQISSVDAKVETLAERVEERFDRIEELLTSLSKPIGKEP